MERIQKIAWWILLAFAWTCVAIFFVWTIGEIYYFAFLPRALGAILAVLYAGVGLALLWKLTPKTRWLAFGSASIIGFYLLSLIQQPSNDRQWDKGQKRQSVVTIDGNHVTIENFRHNLYRSESDFDDHYRDFEFELDQLTNVWFLVQRFTAMEGLAHTFITFEIASVEGPKYFSVSVEIRREKGETYSPIEGMYRAYELLYTIGDERDLIGVRTVHRPDDRVFMYHVNASATQVQSLFREIADRTQELENRPEFYNTFTNNCTNNIVRHTYKLTPEPINWLDPQIVLPGYSDRFALEKGLIGFAGQTFEDLTEQSRIDHKARECGINEQFSTAIRNDSK